MSGSNRRWLIYGKTGWIGGLLGEILTKQGETWAFGDARLEDRQAILADIEKVGFLPASAEKHWRNAILFHLYANVWGCVGHMVIPRHDPALLGGGVAAHRRTLGAHSYAHHRPCENLRSSQCSNNPCCNLAVRAVADSLAAPDGAQKRRGGTLFLAFS